jgi:hypothetical protein
VILWYQRSKFKAKSAFIFKLLRTKKIFLLGKTRKLAAAPTQNVSCKKKKIVSGERRARIGGKRTSGGGLLDVSVLIKDMETYHLLRIVGPLTVCFLENYIMLGMSALGTALGTYCSRSSPVHLYPRKQSANHCPH